MAALAATNPFRITDRLAPDLVETKRLEAGNHPFARFQIILATGQARPDLGGQIRDDGIGDIIFQRTLAQLAGLLDGSLRNHGGTGRIRRLGSGLHQQQGKGKRDETGHDRIPPGGNLRSCQSHAARNRGEGHPLPSAAA